MRIDSINQYLIMVYSRQIRRAMEKENRKSRDAAKRKYQDAIRALVDFVRKRDKRVIQHQVTRVPTAVVSFGMLSKRDDVQREVTSLPLKHTSV